MTIARAVVETSGPRRGSRLVEKTTKTDRVRLVRVGALALDALRAQRDAQFEDFKTLLEGDELEARRRQKDGQVFQAPVGGPLVPYLATEAFRYLRNRLKIDASLHDLRHTAAAWMLAGGIDVMTVAQVLGHSAASTTLNVYGHVVAGAEAKAVAAITTASDARGRKRTESALLAVRLQPNCNQQERRNEKTPSLQGLHGSPNGIRI